MAKVEEWIPEIRKLSDAEAKRYARAIETLWKWEFFRKEYEWTRLFGLGGMIKYYRLKETKEELKRIEKELEATL